MNTYCNVQVTSPGPELNLAIYFYIHVIIIKSVILVVIINITLVNNLINVSYLYLQSLIIAVFWLTVGCM